MLLYIMVISYELQNFYSFKIIVLVPKPKIMFCGVLFNETNAGLKKNKPYNKTTPNKTINTLISSLCSW